MSPRPYLTARALSQRILSPGQWLQAEDEAIRRSNIAATLTGERVMGKYTGRTEGPSRDEIARLAYSFYETRGRRDGEDVDDWLSAELELTRHYR